MFAFWIRLLLRKRFVRHWVFARFEPCLGQGFTYRNRLVLEIRKVQNLFLELSKQTSFWNVWIGNILSSPLLTLHFVNLKKFSWFAACLKVGGGGWKIKNSYLGATPERLWFGEIVISVSPPSVSPSPISILYVRSPVLTMGPVVGLGTKYGSEVALTVRAYLHTKTIESSEKLKRKFKNGCSIFSSREIGSSLIKLWYHWKWFFQTIQSGLRRDIILKIH